MSFIGHQSSKLKKKHFKPKHQKAKVFRANEPLLSVFMWGINHTIHELTHVNIPVMLMPEDFKAYSKIKIENYNYNEESMPKKFMFKEYAPLVFRNLRERFGIDDIDYLTSLTKSQPISLESSSRSHSNSFYKSYNNTLILKKLDTEDLEQLITFLKHYHPYIVERHGKTLLPQYLGLYRITFENTEYYYVVMRNILSCPPTLPIHKKYDLKGSTVDRDASEKERSKPNPTFKDNDFVKDNIKVYIKSEDKQRIMEMLEFDCAFLSKENLMDYSLCLGIHDCERYEEEAKRCLGTALSAVNTGSEEDEEFASIPHSSYSPTRKISDNSFNNGSLNNSDNNLSQKEDSNTSDQDLVLENAIRTIDLNRDIYAIESRADAPQRCIYFLGLVDVLTQYGLFKRTAQAAKTVKLQSFPKHGGQADMISTVHPDQYATRFKNFIKEKVFS